MNITVWRNRLFDTHTIGQLYVNGEYLCFTLEDKVREVFGQPVEKWKVQNETAIPYGTYKVALVDSPHFGPETMTINNVPGFKYIRIHPGNTQADTDGCIILGYVLTPDNMIKYHTTRPAVADLKAKVKEAIKNGEEVTISIIPKSAAIKL